MWKRKRIERQGGEIPRKLRCGSDGQLENGSADGVCGASCGSSV